MQLSQITIRIRYQIEATCDTISFIAMNVIIPELYSNGGKAELVYLCQCTECDVSDLARSRGIEVCQSDGAIVVWRIERWESRYPGLEIVLIVSIP